MIFLPLLSKLCQLTVLVGGSYDGCSTMAEWIKGVLMLVKDKYP
jgi:hypothetical protein